MIRNNDPQDRLYLSQGEQEIYIDNCRIPQHHIEGIRFLYRQFKMHKKGVIINDRFSCGRNIQIILFLKAVRPLLSKSVLILCQEGGEQNWIDRFETWTDLYDDIAVESTSPTFKKLITINAMVNLPVFCDREWSIVIIDGEDNTPTNLILKLPFKADFKIWNTSVDMKKNLDKFSQIYEWLYPNELFDKHYFIPNADSAVDIIEKSILLESFMEDIVLRRADLDSSFEKYRRDVMPPPKAPTTTTSTSTSSTATITTTTVTRKNKDAGGTKIKRSKKTNVTVESQPNKPPTPSPSISSLIGETSKSCEMFDSTEDFSIDNYKRKVMKGGGNVKEGNPFKIIEIGSTEEHSDLKLYYEADSSTIMVDKLEEMDTLVFGHDTLITKVTPKDFDCDKQGIEPAKVVVTSSSKTTEDTKDSTSDSTKICSGNNPMNLNVTERDNKNEKVNLDKEISMSDIVDDRITRRQKDSAMNIDELNKGFRDLDTKDHSEEVKQKNSQDKSNTEILNYEIQVKTHELNKKSNTKDTEQNSLKRNFIDDKMKEYEEKVAKKFKGSLLDSLF